MEKNPFEKVLDEIAELMQYAYDNAHKPVPMEKQMQLEQQLENIEAQVKQLEKMSEDFTSGTDMNDYVFQTMIEDDQGEGIGKEDRTLLQRAEDLKKEAKVASQDALKAAEEARAAGKRISGPKKAKKALSAQARKSKFKTQGGYKHWKPL